MHVHMQAQCNIQSVSVHSDTQTICTLAVALALQAPDRALADEEALACSIQQSGLRPAADCTHVCRLCPAASTCLVQHTASAD